MPSDQKIDYIEIPAQNFDSVQSFYEKAFNGSFTDYGPEYRAFTDDKVDGGFYKLEHRSSTKNGAVLVILYATDLEQTGTVTTATCRASARSLSADMAVATANVSITASTSRTAPARGARSATIHLVRWSTTNTWPELYTRLTTLTV